MVEDLNVIVDNEHFSRPVQLLYTKCCCQSENIQWVIVSIGSDVLSIPPFYANYLAPATFITLVNLMEFPVHTKM